MMFSELASIRVDGAKQAALLLHALAPADRKWVLSQLDTVQHSELLPLIAELDGMGLSPKVKALNRDAFIEASNDAGNTPAMQLQAAAANTARSNPASQTDPEFLMSLGQEGISSLAHAWSVEQPELVAYALKIHPWPWHASLLERLPVAQRSRVQDALGSMASQPAESRLTKAVMAQMRKCCEASERAASVVPGLNSKKAGSDDGIAAQPLQSLLHGWKRWTAGMRREAP